MELIDHFPDFKFETSNLFAWNPDTRVINYSPKRVETNLGKFQLLHEISHAILNHQRPDDSRVYQVERDAWDLARILAAKIGIKSQERFIAKTLRQMRNLGY